MRTGALEKTKDSIEKFFDNLPRKAFTETVLERILTENRTVWNIPDSTRTKKLATFLHEQSWLHEWSFYHESTNDQKIVYSWKSQDELTIISGLKNKSYFTHYTALFIHGLTEQIPKTRYLNVEHSAPTTARDTQVTQEGIDRAFAKEQRKAGEQFGFNRLTVVLLNGQYTDRLGVVERNEPNVGYAYTDLHRTLIDIAVRPAYSGGVFEVLKAYQNAKNLDPKKLKAYLDKLNLVYPYHQVIGFYLQRAGYPEQTLSYFRKKNQFRFYLTYNMKNPQFDEQWDLYYPRGFD